MKCPRCDLFTSNNKDECPRCSYDLRSAKENFNIQSNNVSLKKKKKSSFSDLVAIVDKMLITQKVKEKTTPFSAPSIPVIETQELIQEIHIPNNIEQTSNLDALSKLTEQIVDINKDSSTNLEALMSLTEEIVLPKIIQIPEELWRISELEMARLSLVNSDLGFVEVLDLKDDNEVPLLFELALREILDPTCIQTENKDATKKVKIKSDLDQAVKSFEEAHDQAEAIKKLNILDSSTISLVQDFIIPAKPIQRFSAFAIDIILTLLLTSGFAWVNILPDEVKSKIVALDKQVIFESLPYVSNIFLCFTVLWILTQCAMLATLGSTFGCKVLKIAITDQEGLLLSFKHSLLRSLSWSVTMLSCGIGALLAFFSHKQTLHDRISKTMVIRLTS